MESLHECGLWIVTSGLLLSYLKKSRGLHVENGSPKKDLDVGVKVKPFDLEKELSKKFSAKC